MTPGNIERALEWACVVAVLTALIVGACLVLAGCGVGVPGYEVMYWEVLSKPAPGQVKVDVWYGSLDASPVTMLWTIPPGEWEQLTVGETGTRYIKTFTPLKGN